MEEILVYNLEGEKGKQIQQLCAEMKIRFKSIPAEQYGEPIGALAGIKGVEKTGIPFAGTPFQDEMLVFARFEDASLRNFLSRYYQAGIGKVSLKAGLTPYNVKWNSVELHDELKREHEELKKTHS